MKLFDCDAIKHFPNLVYVDISKNAIEDISPLSHLLAMTHLDARYTHTTSISFHCKVSYLKVIPYSNNKIASLENFAPPLCSFSNSWSTGNKAIGSVLIYANFSNNKISSLDGMSSHPFIECLLLAHNEIASMEGIGPLKNLQVLDLSHNKLTEISDLSGLYIQELSLKGNSLAVLTGLEELPRLRSLDISENHVNSLDPLSKCIELSYLDSYGNDIAKIEDFFVLKSCLNLRKLLGLRNRASEIPSYR